MDVRQHLRSALAAALGGAGVEAFPDKIGVERPGNPTHGDWSSNVALATAKRAGRNPRELAQELADTLNSDLPRHVTAVEVAGAGFVNFRLAPSWLPRCSGQHRGRGHAGFCPVRCWRGIVGQH